MYNLIISSNDSGLLTDSMGIRRILEYTDEGIVKQCRPGSELDLDLLRTFPCLFMQEGIEDQPAHIGQISRARTNGSEVLFEYTLDSAIPPIANAVIYANRVALDISSDFEFSRNHWAVKDVDLYRVLFSILNRKRQRPTVFSIPEFEKIEPTLLSLMIPFDQSFGVVTETIRKMSTELNLNCRRADDIWENPAVIQDVVSLIDRSRIVICDCTKRNANVFYEAGIAHALGREVILITQNEEDIPFDLRHLRFVKYHNNSEGRAILADQLKRRIETVLGH